MSIKINNISFKYDKKTPELTLNDINLNLKESSINVLLGLNGCGKTTLLTSSVRLQDQNRICNAVIIRNKLVYVKKRSCFLWIQPKAFSGKY